MRIAVIFSALLASASTLDASPSWTWEFAQSYTQARFSVRHLMVANVHGVMGPVTGTIHYNPAKPEKTKIQASIDVKALDTKDPKRDKHLRNEDFFFVQENPAMAFKSKKVKKTKEGLEVRGDLTIRDKTREVVLKVTDITDPVQTPYGYSVMGATATTVLDRRDWGLIWNQALEGGGVLVGHEVKVTIDMQLNMADE